MIQQIAPEWHSVFAHELHEMHRLRFRVFKQRLGWDVQTDGDFEIDDFDIMEPHYLLLRGSEGLVNGCVRLLPTTGPTMLRDTFPNLLDGYPVPETPDVWESSRFALDFPASAPKRAGGLSRGTYELFAGMIEFGLSRAISRIVTVTDKRMERILRRAGWPLERIGKPHVIGTTSAVAGYLDVCSDRLDAVRRNGSLRVPVLWAPVVGKAT